jgi:hypothetical protein
LYEVVSLSHIPFKYPDLSNFNLLDTRSASNAQHTFFRFPSPFLATNRVSPSIRFLSMLFRCLHLTLPLPIIATFFAAVFAKAGHYPWHNTGISTHLITKRQSSSTFSVTGVHTGSGPNGSLPLRREIRDLEQDQKSWDLYILGLDFMQSVDQEEMLSWYQIAGLHTMFWDGEYLLIF